MNSRQCARCCEDYPRSGGQIIGFANEEHAICETCVDDLRDFMSRSVPREQSSEKQHIH